MSSDIILVIVVGTALAFDFTNGFHDTANVVATSISTRAARPQVAIGIASLLNFAGAFISISVAATVANDVVDSAVITPTVVFAGLIGAIAWNLITWWFGLPSSSSHALIGGVVGSAVAASGIDAVLADGLVGKVLIPAVIAPILAFVVAGIGIGVAYRVVGRQRPGPVTRGFRYGQVISGGLLALAHGTNDAQKTMGVITLALVANGTLGAEADPPLWVIVSAATAIALGTYSGGWRIIRTTGTRIIKMDAAQGFSSSGGGRRRHPRLDPLRLPPFDHARDQRRRHGLGGRQAPLGGSLGGGGQHRRRLAVDAPGGRCDRRARLRRQQHLRQRSARSRDRHAHVPLPDRRHLRATLAAGGAGPGGLSHGGRCPDPRATADGDRLGRRRDRDHRRVLAGHLGRGEFVELSREERPLAAGGAAVVGVLALTVTLAAVVVGIVVMTSK